MSGTSAAQDSYNPSNPSGDSFVLDPFLLSPVPLSPLGRSSDCISSLASGQTRSNKLIRRTRSIWNKYLGPIRTLFNLLGISDLLRVYLSCVTKQDVPRSSGKVLPNSTVALQRTLAFVWWALGCISISLVSGLIVFFREMVAFRISAARFGFPSSSQQELTRSQKDDLSSATELEDRLEVAHLAVKQLKSESLALREKLREAGERISRLQTEANQADHAAFQALQAKYDQVASEIARLTRENEELKTNMTRLGKENAELRQCLAINGSDTEDETNRLGMLARLQNQSLDSCIFSKKDRDEKESCEGKLVDATDDSIVFVTGTDSPRRVQNEQKGTSIISGFPLPPSVAGVQNPLGDNTFPTPSKLIRLVSAPGLATPPPEKSEPKGPSPIPVFTTKRPSLPPKGSKLKPLLLAAHFSGPGSLRRHGGINNRMRKNSLRQQGTSHLSDPSEKQVEIVPVSSGPKTQTLNPLAPAFTPRNVSANTGTVPIMSESKEAKINQFKASIISAASKATSPSASPFIITSPSPNSPFLRPAPARRQTEDTPHPPTVTTTPPTPASTTPIAPTPTPIPAPPSTIAASSVQGTGNKGTPRSTRASSVRLIRARAALRNSQRLASGSDVIPPRSPAGFKTMADISDPSGGGSKKNAKVRLIGKGMPPPRRALGEVTNAELGYETSGSRWPSV